MSSCRGFVVAAALFAANMPALGETIQLHVTLRDFCTVAIPGRCRPHPDFESNVGSEKGIVARRLGHDRKPIYALEGKPSRTTTGKENFDQWYRDVPGVNVAVPFTLTLTNQHSTDKRIFRYVNDAFFPLDGKGFDEDRSGINYSFTLELHARFRYRGGEVLKFSGEDDVWIFINGVLAIDLGGVHPTESAEIALDREAGRLGLAKGGNYAFDLFFAERHSVDSTFSIETSLRLVDDAADAP